jgi:FkbM family methyltransferase
MITVAEHSFEETLLPANGNILDLGCRGFLFADALEMKGKNVVCVDVDELGAIDGFHYHRCAIASENGLCGVRRSKDPQATTIVKAQVSLAGFDVPMYTLKSFSEKVGIPFWDLIKIDIEGSEYEVIRSLTEPPAKQLSIEFHLHTKIYGMKEVLEMEAKLSSLGYEAVSHTMTSQHGMGMNYWDSLFILK